ncbi:MAG: ABC-type transport auxiliary lipoprotein family protein [Nitrospirota bacterium]
MMRSRQVMKVGCLIALCTAAAGCVNLNKSYPEKRSFVLEVSRDQETGPPRIGPVLKIARFRVSPQFEGRELVVRTGEFQYDMHFYDVWLVTPGAMLGQQFYAWLSRTGQFQYVLLGSNHAEAAYVLAGDITAFHGDYREGRQPTAVLGLDLHVIDGKQEASVVWQRRYRQEVPLSDRLPDELARGLNEALRLVLLDVEKDLLFLGRPSAPR